VNLDETILDFGISRISLEVLICSIFVHTFAEGNNFLFKLGFLILGFGGFLTLY